MRTKDSRLWAYNLALVATTVAVASLAWPWLAEWPVWWVVVGFALFQLLVWQYGYVVPSMGMTSMERVPQVAAILMFPTEIAACINALPALVFPFINRRYRQGSLGFGALRAVHNACMIALMTSASGAVYSALGGTTPLLAPVWADLFALLGAMLVLQAINSVMMLVFLALDRRDVRRIVSWSYLFVDELFVPIGVLAALICNRGEPVAIALLVGFLLLTVLSMHELVESRRKMQDRVAALDAASGTRMAVSGARRIDELAERLLERIGALFDYRIAFIALHDIERAEFDVVLEIIDGQRQPRCRKPVGEGLSGHVLRTGSALLIDRWEQAPEALRARAVLAPGESPGSVLIVPITLGGVVLAVVSVQHDVPGRYTEADRNALLAIAEDLAPVIADARTFQELHDYRESLETLVAERTAALEQASAERERLLRELQANSRLLERQSREDALTGLANRRQFDECIVAEIARAGRHGHALCLALIDIDHFKRINDLGGHALGDAVLAQMGHMLRLHFRAEDLVARIGGEEFAVLMPQTRVDDALGRVQDLREKVAAHVFGDESAVLRVTISVGLAQWGEGEHRDALLRRTDSWLYQAKHLGRNRVHAGAY